MSSERSWTSVDSSWTDALEDATFPQIKDDDFTRKNKYKEQFFRVYNTYLVEALVQARKRDASLKSVLHDAGHKAIDIDSVKYIDDAASSLAGEVRVAVLSDDFDPTAVSHFEPITGVTCAVLYAKAPLQDSEIEHFYMLVALAAARREIRESDPSCADGLATAVINAIRSIQSGADVSSDVSVDAVLDDDIGKVLRKIRKVRRDDATAQNAALLSSIRGTKLGDLALRVGDDVVKNLSSSSNEDGGGSPLDFGSILQQMGSTLHSQLASGELKQEDLVKDSMAILSALGGSGGGGGVGGGGLESALGALGALGGRGVVGGAGNMSELLQKLTAARPV
ncbi:hypothetical protein CEUSTIGMA_g12195.t1 [Chlamydomonas eustigma]|uniref:Uncharacterized protein n=1 Tax=Chlamydomonas eustigma TaxID=1157962 RepID=A0A250XP49_9CHLO|nr:hypothetical protein CEUSTIGMA_g12195.t1 [Chlamydomonas eustigma]|eukprot:GAX84773.1 hypothetical protein CEUSTIGMA_g12195.t1 [Chlamydomonas eustigma]